MIHGALSEEYFEWLCDIAYGGHSTAVSYDHLLMRLHETEFRYLMQRDKNCAEHGVYMRYRFADMDSDLIEGPCSVLEMLLALAWRCEENIMDDPIVGNRTSQWFWNMIVNLGLGMMHDRKYDEEYVDEVIERFLEREYEPDGRGGLFRIRDCDEDLRNVAIFHQMCWYLDTIT